MMTHANRRVRIARTALVALAFAACVVGCESAKTAIAIPFDVAKFVAVKAVEVPYDAAKMTAQGAVDVVSAMGR